MNSSQKLKCSRYESTRTLPQVLSLAKSTPQELSSQRLPTIAHTPWKELASLLPSDAVRDKEMFMKLPFQRPQTAFALD